MTIKHLNGIYPDGYTLAAKFSGVSVATFGTVLGTNGVYSIVGFPGGAALSLPSGGSVINSGSIIGGVGGNGGFGFSDNPTPAGGAGGAGVTLSAKGTVTNYNLIAGGAGGNVYRINYAYAYGSGGAGVVLGDGGRVVNLATIRGGASGSNGYRGGYLADGVDLVQGGTVANGDSAHFNALIEGYSGVEAAGRAVVINYGTIKSSTDASSGAAVLLGDGGTVVNHFIIEGAQGIPGIYTGRAIFLPPTAGRAGISLVNGGSVLNEGYIEGGAGGQNLITAVVGAGGDGVDVAVGGTITNLGFIKGGYGGYSHTYSGPQADGVSLANGGLVTNGATGLIQGGVGVYAAGRVTVVNYGLIAGSDVSVQLTSASDRLVVESGASFYGAIAGGGGTLELAGGTGTITGLGAVGTLSGAAAGTFSGFGSYVLDAGAAWSLAGVNAIAGTLTNAGVLTNTGTADQTGLVALTRIGEIDNAAGATWNLANNVILGVGSSGNFTNEGTVARAATAGANVIRADFANTGTVSIAGGALDLEGASNSLAGVLDGPGNLSLAAGTTGLSALELANGVTLGNSATVNQGGVLTVTNGSISNRAGAAWNLTDDIDGGAGRFSNAGTLTRQAEAGVNNIGVDFTNTGTVNVAGGTLAFSGPVNSFAGTIAGAGTIGFTGGATTLAAGLDLTVGAVSIGGGATSVALDESLTWSKLWTQSAGAVSISAGDELTFMGVGDSFSGALTGAGSLAFKGGSDAFDFLTLSATHMTINGATVSLQDVITLTGSLAASGSVLTVDSAGAGLSGGGTLTLFGEGDTIEGIDATAKLINVNDRIQGGGQLGNGQMALANVAGASIIGNSATALFIDTGAQVIANGGLIEETGAGGTVIASAISNTGTLEATHGTLLVEGVVIGAGKAVIASGGTADFASNFTQNVAFGVGGGTLELAKSQAYGGTITGFSKTGATAFDLGDIGFISGVTTATYNGTTAGGVLTVTDGTHVADIKLAGNYLASIWTVSTDGHGGTTAADPTAGPPTAAPIANLALLTGQMASLGPAASATAQVSAPLYGTPPLIARPV